MEYKTTEIQRNRAKKQREANPEKYRQYLKEWRNKNKSYMKDYLKQYYIEHKDKLIQKATDWNKTNLNKHRESRRIAVNKYRKVYPERIRAHKREFYHKQRDNKCSMCGSTENLHFHHIDYNKDEGFTLCAKCHKKIHRKEEDKDENKRIS